MKLKSQGTYFNFKELFLIMCFPSNLLGKQLFIELLTKDVQHFVGNGIIYLGRKESNGTSIELKSSSCLINWTQQLFSSIT